MRVRALLQCLAQPLPRAWELHDEARRDEAAGEVNFLLQDRIAEEDALDGASAPRLPRSVSPQLEACSHPPSVYTELEIVALNAELAESFELFAPVESDEVAARSYSLTRISKELQKDLGACVRGSRWRVGCVLLTGCSSHRVDGFKDWRISRLNRHRRGAAVQDTTFANDQSAVLRCVFQKQTRLGRTLRCDSPACRYMGWLSKAHAGVELRLVSCFGCNE